MPNSQVFTGLLVRRTQQAHLALWQLLVSREISSPQFGVLAELNSQPGISQADLCLRLDLDKSTINDLVNRLVNRSLIYRNKDVFDRRKYVLTLTALGLAELGVLQPKVATLDEALTSGLSASERTQLQVLLSKLLENTKMN